MVIEKDRRRFERAEVTWPAAFITSDGQILGETKSISQFGVSIYCPKLPPIGQECRLEIQPPGHQPIIVSAQPIWSSENTHLDISRRFVVGTEFEYISEDDARFLGEIIVEQEQQKD